MCDFSKREIISILFKRDAGNGDGLEILYTSSMEGVGARDVFDRAMRV